MQEFGKYFVTLEKPNENHMETNRLLQVLMAIFIGMLPFPVLAQSYDQLWKEVEMYQKKDLPKSVIATAGKIYAKAKAERNLPQLMKAHLVRASQQVSLTPDSAEVEYAALGQWAEEEKDTVGRAVLHSIVGSWMMANEPDSMEAAIAYFRASVAPKEVLGRTSAKEFRPMTESGKQSERYFNDNMLDLLTRTAIQQMSTLYSPAHLPKAKACMELYDGLIDYYKQAQNREAALLTEVAKLWFQKRRMDNFKPYRLTDDELIASLHGLIDTYAGQPACADAYVKLVVAYRDANRLKEAVETAREGLAKYSKGEWAKDLQGQIDYITRPMLNVDIPFLYPNYETDANVTYANIEGVTLELYRLNLAPTAAQLQFREETDRDALLKQYGTKVSSRFYALRATEDYQRRDTVLRYTLPGEGIYMLKQIPKGVEKGIASAVMFVSPYQAIELPVQGRQHEFIAVDRLTGRPVPGAEIVTYQLNIYDAKADYALWNVHRTDAQGRTAFEVPKRTGTYYNVRTPGHDFMAITRLSTNNGIVDVASEGWKKQADLFTDRSLYRPGQTVYVSGVVYGQEGDSIHVASYAKDKLKLYRGSQNVGEADVCTDEFGVFSHEFALPDNLLPGQYYLSGYDRSVVIQVDEYKRPTFEVRFDPYKEAYTMGDSVRVSAEAKTYAGAPVRNARVKYRVVRTEMSWFRWQGATEELLSGETQTDADGKFYICARLTEPDYEAEHTYYIYKVSADVTDGAGETRQGELALPAGEQTLGLQLKGLNANVMREKQERIQVQAMNLNGQPVQVEVAYKVYALDKEGKKGALRYEGKAESMQSFVPSDVWALPSGRYRMEVSAQDEKGRPCTAEQDFVLFSKTDRTSPVEETAWFYQDGDSFGSQEPPTFYIGTNEEGVCLFIDVYDGQRRIESRQVTLEKELKAFSFPYREAYGDAVTVAFTFMRKGNLYTNQSLLTRPVPDKRLMMKWETFRDRLQPGGQETWTLHIARPSGMPAEANLMATLYDASLDVLRKHDWRFGLSFPRRAMYVRADFASAFQRVHMYGNFPITYPGEGFDLLYGEYSRLYSIRLGGFRIRGIMMSRANMVQEEMVEVKQLSALEGAVAADMAAPAPAFQMKKGDVGGGEIQISIADVKSGSSAGAEQTPMPALRENFAETAFFYPNLRTDSLGNVSVSFTVPDALTQWRFLGFAHTRAMDYGLLVDTVQTSKPFMVQPNLPRFIRRGDRAVIAASLVNLSMETVSGIARIEWSDPVTGKVVAHDKQSFSVSEGETGTVHFTFGVPETYDVLVCKIVAEAGEHSDGEQHYVPVLTDKQWMTETVPVQLDGTETKSVAAEDLFNKQSKTATEKRLTVEMTANPDWYAVQALPVMGNPSEEDALSWASAYYANALAAHIVRSNPRIEEVFRTWKAEGAGKETLLSNLERNQDLKNLLLAETPWVAEATDEAEQKRRIALLFDLNTMSNRQQTAIGKLEALQLPDGSWSWYKGMTGSRYITTQIVEMLARLQAMQVTLEQGVGNMYVRAVDYLKKEAQREYEQMKRREVEHELTVWPDGQIVHYLYICAIDKLAANHADGQVNDYFIAKLENRSADYSICEKAMIALVMQRAGKSAQASELVQSIKEYLVGTEEMGLYFDTPKAAYSWRSYKIPAQVAAMEAIYRIAPDTSMLNGMKQWLLKQKQVQAWESSVSTADAVYAFLCMGSDTLGEGGSMEATVGKTTWQTPQDALGYARKTFTGTDAEADDIRISRTGEGLGWGAVYAQYLEDMDKVLPSKGTGLQIERTLYRDGKALSRNAELHVGDKVTVRLTVSADRDMDFVQVKDERAACMEPEQQLSGYSWSGGIGYYRVSRDASTSFFIDRMQKGTYQLEYTVYIDRAGTYQAGSATVQSAYAPEYSGYTAGETLTVK